MSRRAVRAVLFDAAHTLLYVRPSVGAVYAETALRFGVALDPAAVEGAFRSAFGRRRGAGDAATSEALEYAWWRGLVREVMAETGRLEAFGDRFDAYFAAQFEAFAGPEAWAFYDDVEPAFDALRGMGVAIGVVSNWDGRLHRLAASTFLGSYAQAIVTSADAGYRKPHPAPFRMALARLGAAAEEAVFVGDSAAEDVAGAGSAGLAALLLDRGGRSAAAEAIVSLSEVPDRIRGGLPF